MLNDVLAVWLEVYECALWHYEANPGPVLNCDVDSWSLKCTNTERRSNSYRLKTAFWPVHLFIQPDVLLCQLRDQNWNTFVCFSLKAAMLVILSWWLVVPLRSLIMVQEIWSLRPFRLWTWAPLFFFSHSLCVSSYQRKYPYNHIGRTLCQPPTRAASETQYFFVDVSTLSVLGTKYQFRVSRVESFTLQ